MVFTWILSYLRVGALLFISSYLAQNDLILQSTGRINDLDHTNKTNSAQKKESFYLETDKNIHP